MKAPISSAGLLYLYLNGYEENGMLSMQQVNTYAYIEDGFYHQLMASAKEADHNANSIQIFAVVGIKEKSNRVCSIIENEIKSNYRRMISGKKIKKGSGDLDKTGNVFHRCVQEFFCEQQSEHFAKHLYRDYGRCPNRN